MRNRRFVFGIRTGRCGTLSLARLLNSQIDAKVTHEMRPLLDWGQLRPLPAGDMLLSQALDAQRPKDSYKLSVTEAGEGTGRAWLSENSVGFGGETVA